MCCSLISYDINFRINPFYSYSLSSPVPNLNFLHLAWNSCCLFLLAGQVAVQSSNMTVGGIYQHSVSRLRLSLHRGCNTSSLIVRLQCLILIQLMLAGDHGWVEPWHGVWMISHHGLARFLQRNSITNELPVRIANAALCKITLTRKRFVAVTCLSKPTFICVPLLFFPSFLTMPRTVPSSYTPLLLRPFTCR